MTRPRRILVTGAAGLIGRKICPFLQAKGLSVRAFDRRSQEAVEDEVIGDLADLDALRRAAADTDTVVHLAGCADEADFVTGLVPANVIGLYNALEATRLEGVPRFVFASSIRATDFASHRGRIAVADRHATDSYGLTKLWGEDLAELYSRLHGIAVLAARLGWVVRDERELREIRSLPRGDQLYLGDSDLCEFFFRAATAGLAEFAIVYVTSQRSDKSIFDMKAVWSLLGFEPQDDFSGAAAE